MWVASGILQGGDNRTTDVLTREGIDPMLSRLRANDFGDAGLHDRRVRARISKRVGQFDERAEIGPEPVFERSRREIAAVGSRVDLITRTATCNERVARSWPRAGAETIAKSPIGKRQQVLAHRDIEIGSFAGLITLPKSE